MKTFKKLPLALTVVGLGAVSSFAEIKLTDNLSVTGFLDMSTSGEVNDSDETLNATFDQFEIDFLYKNGNVSGRADISQGGVGGGVGAVHLEQGFVSYALGSAAVTAGRFLSSSGFEAAEPTGLYQYSYSKTVQAYGGYQDGLALSFSNPLFGLYGAVVSDLWVTGQAELLNTPGFEGQVSLTPVEGVTAKVAYLHQIVDTTGDDSKQVVNAWASYAMGRITVAAEYNLLLNWESAAGKDETGSGWLGMANYKITDKVAATVRYSGIMLPDADGDDEVDQEVTFSPSFAVTPNWLVLAEVQQQFGIADKTAYAVESLLSF